MPLTPSLLKKTQLLIGCFDIYTTLENISLDYAPRSMKGCQLSSAGKPFSICPGGTTRAPAPWAIWPSKHQMLIRRDACGVFFFAKGKSQCKLLRVLDKSHSICSKDLDDFQNATVGMLLGLMKTNFSLWVIKWPYNQKCLSCIGSDHHYEGWLGSTAAHLKDGVLKPLICWLPQADKKPLGGKLTTLDLAQSWRGNNSFLHSRYKFSFIE